MANDNYPKLNIISECFIRPNSEVEQSQNPYYLSSHDLFQLSTAYMHRGLLYAKPPTFSIDTLVEKLKHSLSITLVEFYPLAGRLATTKYEDDHTSCVHVECKTSPGATLIHASANEEYNKVTISDIVSGYESISRFIWSLFDKGDLEVVNHDGHTRALISVQVTDLVDGVFIGFAMNHSLGDGASLWHFIKALSNVMEGKNIEKPIFKDVFADGYGPVIKLPYLDPSEFITRFNVDPRLTLRVFHFSVGSIAKLKSEANTDNTNKAISSFQALSAFVWLSVARARNLPLESEMGCWLTANTRLKHDPPLPSNHFGNFVHLLRVTSKMKDLMSNGLGWAAMMLHQEVMGLDRKAVMANLKARNEKPQVAPIKHMRRYFGDNPPLIFTGSMRFDAYGPEFGLGKAVSTRTGYSTWMNGRVVIDPGGDGGGSAELQICLLSETMAALESDDKFMSYIT